MKATGIKISVILFFVLNTLVGFEAAATPPDPGGGGGDPGCWPPPCTIPVDGGIGILIAAGLAYGSKKVWDIQKGRK